MSQVSQVLQVLQVLQVSQVLQADLQELMPLQLGAQQLLAEGVGQHAAFVP